LVAIDDRYVYEGPTGGCTRFFEDIDSFVAQGGRRINERSAISYGRLDPSDGAPGGTVFMPLPEEHLRICLEMNLGGYFSEHAYALHQNYTAAIQEFPISSLFTKSYLDPNLRRTLQEFEAVGLSLSPLGISDPDL
jgi:hypothetical protein